MKSGERKPLPPCTSRKDADKRSGTTATAIRITRRRRFAPRSTRTRSRPHRRPHRATPICTSVLLRRRDRTIPPRSARRARSTASSAAKAHARRRAKITTGELRDPRQNVRRRNFGRALVRQIHRLPHARVRGGIGTWMSRPRRRARLRSRHRARRARRDPLLRPSVLVGIRRVVRESRGALHERQRRRERSEEGSRLRAKRMRVGKRGGMQTSRRSLPRRHRRRKRRDVREHHVPQSVRGRRRGSLRSREIRRAVNDEAIQS